MTWPRLPSFVCLGFTRLSYGLEAKTRSIGIEVVVVIVIGLTRLLMIGVIGSQG